VRSEVAGYDVLPANRELGGAEIELVEVERREYRLKDALAAVAADYDYIIVDCPPALNLLPCPRLGPASTIQPLRIQPRQVAAKNKMGCLSAEDAVYGPEGCPIRFCGTRTPRLALPAAPAAQPPP
jgi:hypothetical protein